MKQRRGEKRPQADEVDALFRTAVVDVTPLPARNQASHKRRLPKPVPALRTPAGRDVDTDSMSDHVPSEARQTDGEAFSFARSGISRHQLRQLRRGGSKIQDELDLHGLTTAEARPLLAAFLDHCRDEDMRRVRIIHGKGLRSENREAVLKGKVAGWLMQREDVLAFCEARAAEGGSGAVVVLLKSGGCNDG